MKYIISLIAQSFKTLHMKILQNKFQNNITIYSVCSIQAWMISLGKAFMMSAF